MIGNEVKRVNVSSIQESINEELIVDKDDPLEEVDETEESRFFMLTHIDETSTKYNDYVYKDDISLETLCIEFRNYAASKLKLYYDIKDIRRFIGGLAVSQIMILQGMSGTGKTSLAYAFGEYINNQAVVVPIQPMWKGTYRLDRLL